MQQIKVKNDWNWVDKYVDEQLKSNEQLYDDVFEYMREKRIGLDRVKELYHDGINHGIEDGMYLSFNDWFYEFTQ